jgi:hypothetical protein
MKTKKSNFKKDLVWGEYFEGALNLWIEPHFNHQLYLKKKTLAWSTLRSSDIYPKKKDWYKFDTLYHLYELDNPEPIKQITFEIKADKYDNTGNVCIEKKCSNKMSGVFHTEADYFIYYMPRYTHNNLYLFKPAELCRYLSKYNNLLRNLGDGDRSLSYIIDKTQFDKDILDDKIGKIYTYNAPIPEEFGVSKFEAKTKSNTYQSDKMKKYDDVFNWKD